MKDLVNIKKLVKRIYIILWLILAFFFILKLCFNLWYPIVIDNDRLMALSYWIDDKRYIKNFLLACMYCFSMTIGYLIMSGKYSMSSTKEKILIIIISYISFILKSLFISWYIILELLIILVLPMIIRKRKWYIAIFYLVLIFLWQATFLFIRGAEDIDNLSIAIIITLQIDYYIFLGILYLRGRWQLMGLASFLLFGKKLPELEQLLKQELALETPDTTKVAELEKAIHNAKIEEKKKELDNEKVE